MTEHSPLGILLVNLGTPDSPTAPDIRRYLAEFLSDPRVVSLPRMIWLPILHGFILPFRPKKLVEKYEGIWDSKGAPIRFHTEELANLLSSNLIGHLKRDYIVRSAMTYGNPSIESALVAMQEKEVKDIIVLPLFPQYSAATTAAVLDKLNTALAALTEVPDIRFITDYHDNQQYIRAVASSLIQYKDDFTNGTKLVLSFHGLPQAQIDAGDPYAKHCETTATLIAESLGLNSAQWQLTYQSRFGPAPWLKPDTSSTLQSLPAQGITKVIVACPGFSVDCLETLEEIDDLNRSLFLAAGGKQFTYVPALNAEQVHVDFILNLLDSHLYKWESELP